MVLMMRLFLLEVIFGIAMGGVGSDVAIEAADVVLMSDDITSIAKAIQVSHYTNFILKEKCYFYVIN